MAAQILVIDEDDDLLELYTALLEEEGYKVHPRKELVEDLKDIEQLSPDLIILDLSLQQRKEAWTLLHRLKMHSSVAAIPIVVCITTSLSLDQEDYLRESQVGIVYKPFDIDELGQRIRRLICTH